MAEVSEILAIAGLSKINVTDFEMDKICKQFEEIEHFVSVISDADLQETEQKSKLKCDDLRKDCINKSVCAEDILKNAPETQNGYFLLRSKNICKAK